MAAATHIAAAAAVAPSTKEGRHVPKEARYIRAPLQLSQIVEEAHEVNIGEYRLRSEDRLVAGDRRAMTRD